MATKLAGALDKYGYADHWAVNAWEAECKSALLKHVQKGDPVDVAAYAAFCWSRGWTTTPADGHGPFLYPVESSQEIKDILGMMVFECSPIAHGFQAAGYDIPKRVEDEQAFVLHWLLLIALQHGPSWREIAAKRLNDVLQAAKAQASDAETEMPA